MINSEVQLSRLNRPLLLNAFFLISLLSSLSLLVGCAKDASVSDSFSQRPGFAHFYKNNPRAEVVPAARYQRMLTDYKPHLWLDDTAEGPIDFYQDYISAGELRNREGDLISDAVSPELLNRYRDDPTVTFEHTPSNRPTLARAYGRVDHDQIEGFGAVTALTWHYVFRHSGIPAGISKFKKAVLDLVGDTRDWHQLDNYTAASLILDSQNRPLALLLQQHNYQRSYLYGCDLRWPADNRPAIASAMGSNELYPYKSGERRWRSVPFMSKKGVNYLITGKDRPLMSADDITLAQREVDYTLSWLAPSDAFYSFAGYLGTKRRLPGREGPPGADYNTLAPFKAVATQVVAFNWSEGDLQFIDWVLPLIQASWNDGTLDVRAEPIYQAMRQRFIDRLKGCDKTPALQ